MGQFCSGDDYYMGRTKMHMMVDRENLVASILVLIEEFSNESDRCGEFFEDMVRMQMETLINVEGVVFQDER